MMIGMMLKSDHDLPRLFGTGVQYSGGAQKIYIKAISKHPCFSKSSGCKV
jgi:hypothetical protein